MLIFRDADNIVLYIVTVVDKKGYSPLTMDRCNQYWNLYVQTDVYGTEMFKQTKAGKQ